MENEQVQQLVVRAVQQSYDDWAVEHPSLAGVIDRISLTEQSVERLRNSPEFSEAMESYHGASVELRLLDRLIELAGPVVSAILAG